MARRRSARREATTRKASFSIFLRYFSSLRAAPLGLYFAYEQMHGSKGRPPPRYRYGERSWVFVSIKKYDDNFAGAQGAVLIIRGYYRGDGMIPLLLAPDAGLPRLAAAISGTG